MTGERGDRNTLGKALKALRKGAGLTQAELAKEIGYERTSITNVERGNQVVTDVMVNAWAFACGFVAVVKFQKIAAIAPLRQREFDAAMRHLEEERAFETNEGIDYDDNWQ